MIKFQGSQKVRLLKSSFLFKQAEDQGLNQTLQEVQPLLTDALNTAPEFYSQIKQETLNEVQRQHGDEAIDEVRKMFEQFEIEYMKETLESMRPLLEIALVFGGQLEIEKIEEELLSQLIGVLEEGAIEEIKSFFQSVYQTQLLKKLKLLKQENGNETITNVSSESFSMEQEFYEIVPILTEILNKGVDHYAQIKYEALAEIQQQNGDEVMQQARKLFQQFETNYIQKALEKMRPQFEYIKEHEGEKGILSYEKAYVEEIISIFEPAAVEVLQRFFQELYKITNFQKIKIIGLWGWSDFTDWAQEAYNDTKDWSKSTYERGKE